MNAAKANYCNMNTAQRLSNGLTGAAYATLGAVTSITCDDGYVSSTASTAPFFSCDVGTATVGVWSSIYHTCVGVLVYLKFYLYESSHTRYSKIFF